MEKKKKNSHSVFGVRERESALIIYAKLWFLNEASVFSFFRLTLFLAMEPSPELPCLAVLLQVNDRSFFFFFFSRKNRT